MGERRFRNILKRMMGKEDFYTNCCSPRISKAEIKEIETQLNVQLQTEHTFGAMPGPIAVYPLHQSEFDKKAREFLKKER